jgi:hypothetical protein
VVFNSAPIPAIGFHLTALLRRTRIPHLILRIRYPRLLPRRCRPQRQSDTHPVRRQPLHVAARRHIPPPGLRGLLAACDNLIQGALSLAGISLLRITQLAGLVDFIVPKANFSNGGSKLVGSKLALVPSVRLNLAAILRTIILIRQQTCLEAIRRLHTKVPQQITDAGVTLIVAEQTVARHEVGGAGPYVRI